MNTVKKLIFHFSSGEVLPVEIGDKYQMRLDSGGCFIVEKSPNQSIIATPEEKYRTVKLIQMVNVDYIETEYED